MSGSVFLDTNVLLEATDTARAHHAIAHRIFSTWPERGIDLSVSGQVLREYLVVATRPRESNGLGLGSVEALENVRRFRSRAAICPETEQVFGLLQQLAGRLQTQGKKFHDLNIAATALATGLKTIVTANPRDFPAEFGLEVIDLAEAESAFPP